MGVTRYRADVVGSARIRPEPADRAEGERRVELWATRTPEAGTVERQAQRAEAAGWDGITFTDSQNLVGDPFVAVALAARATDTLRFATGVANVATRVPAAL